MKYPIAYHHWIMESESPYDKLVLMVEYKLNVMLVASTVGIFAHVMSPPSLSI